MKKKIIIISASVLVAAGIIAYACFNFFGSDYIGRDAAKKAVLTEMGFEASEVKHIETDFEHEHGLRYYDVSVIVGTTEYECAVDAKTGEILLQSSEPVFD